jgi:hypothetical protein
MPERMKGGNTSRVVKDGRTVLRSTGAWSPFVHQLLQHLAAVGFTEAPVFIEQVGDQEQLSFVAGEVGNDPLKPYMQTDEVLVEAAQLLRRLHDCTQSFAIPVEAAFMLPVMTPHEVICHNDFAPYNCVYRDGHLIGVIDFDTAGPGTRLWDIAYAVYRFVPLTNDPHSLDNGWNPIPDRAARLRLFCDSYGLDDRGELIATVRLRLQALVDFMRRTDSNLEHIPFYEADLQYLSEHEAEFTAAIIG